MPKAWERIQDVTTRHRYVNVRLDMNLVGLQEHVDDAWGSVAPVHQKVSIIPDAGGVVP